jgi:hypothetical protein
VQAAEAVAPAGKRDVEAFLEFTGLFGGRKQFVAAGFDRRFERGLDSLSACRRPGGRRRGRP